MSRYTWRFLRLALLGTVGCAPNRGPVDRPAQFDPAEYAPYDQPGTSVVEGQAFLRIRFGEIRYGAGSEVYLSPVTSYSKEWWSQATARDVKFSSGPDARASKYTKVAVADLEGRFSFAELPAGDYFVVSSVFWEVPDTDGLRLTGSRVGRPVHVGPGQRVTVVLDELTSTPADGQATTAVATPPAATTPTSSPVPGAGSAKPAGNLRSNNELRRSLNLRRALADLTRLRLITDYQEAASGVLQVVLGEGYQKSQALEYNLEKLRRAYAESTNFDAEVDPHLELVAGRPSSRPIHSRGPFPGWTVSSSDQPS